MPSTPPAGSTPAVPTEPQVFYRGGVSRDPTSHDFNADIHCGGEPSLWAGLLTFNANFEPVADWAESWETSADGRQWTFYLRVGNSGWSDGAAVDAADFVWSWQRKLHPETGAPDAAVLFPIKNAAQVHAGSLPPEALGVRALDTWTLQVELEAPTGYFLAIVASPSALPAYRPAVEQWGAAWTEAGNCVSNGPFLLETWVHDERIEIRRNPHYWNAQAIDLERCVTPILAGDRGINPYLIDAVDTLPVPGDLLPVLQADPVLQQQLVRSVNTATWMLLPQVSFPPFDDLRVRRAMSHAIDRDRIVQVMHGRVAPARSLLPLGFPGHISDPGIARIQLFDVDAALDLLSTTAFAGGQGWPELTVTMRDEDPDAELIARDVIDQLRDNLGMRLTLEILEPADFAQVLATQSRPLVWLRWWFDYPDPNNGYRDLIAPTVDQPLAWSHPGYDVLVAQAAATTDPAQRAAIYAECERLLQEEVAYIPVVYPVAWYLVKPWVVGLPVTRGGYRALDNGLYTRMNTTIRIQGRPAQ